MNNYDHTEALEKAKKELEEKNSNLLGELTSEKIETIEDDNEIMLTSGRILKLDLETLTGNDILEVKEKYQKIKKRKAAMLEEFDDFYYMLIAEKVTGISYKEFVKLPYKDYNKIKNSVRDFLNED